MLGLGAVLGCGTVLGLGAVLGLGSALGFGTVYALLTHIHMHTCTHAHMHTCTHAHMHVHVHLACTYTAWCMACQVFSSFTLVGGICTVGWRQFARWGDVDNTYLACLAAGGAAGALNVLRFVQDLPEMRRGSVLQRELSEGQFRTVSRGRVRGPTLVHGAVTSGPQHRCVGCAGCAGLQPLMHILPQVSLLFWSSGLLVSGHQLWLGHPVATFLSLSLNAAAAVLLYVAMMRLDALQGTADAAMALGGLAGLMFATTMTWWAWDGVKLLRGKVLTSGERIVTKDDVDDVGAAC